MADQTTNLKLPLILNSQAQKHITHNEALRALDALVQISIKDRDLAAPPASPVEGRRYIVAAGATGAWSGRALDIAAYQDGAWIFYDPSPGWLAYIEDEAILTVFTGSSWVQCGTSLSLLGINAMADTSNRLTVSAPASLFNHEGSDHRIKINKAAAANTASMLFQTGFSGRAEFGLTGDDNWHVKVSANGSSWSEAIVIDRTSAMVTLPKSIDSNQVLVAQNAVGIVDAANSGGLVVISQVSQLYPQSTVAGLFSYDCGPTPALTSIAIGTGLSNLGTTVPTGATGTSGRINVAVDQGHIYLENRTASASQLCLTYLNGYRGI